MDLQKVLVAMSGGVDSSFSAYMLKQQGFECAGITMILSELSSNEQNVEMANQASEVCAQNHLVVNYVAEFKKHIISKFVESYENGCTPNPCIFCNRIFKFGKLLDYALDHGYDYLATGHYAQIEFSKTKNRFLLKKAADIGKDQTYFLYFLKQNQLKHVLFPLGKMYKQQIKNQANLQGFSSAKRQESQDICFVGEKHYADFIKNFTKKTYGCGNFIDETGKILGQHEGLINYTVGQRKGLKLSLQMKINM